MRLVPSLGEECGRSSTTCPSELRADQEPCQNGLVLEEMLADYYTDNRERPNRSNNQRENPPTIQRFCAGLKSPTVRPRFWK